MLPEILSSHIFNISEEELKRQTASGYNQISFNYEEVKEQIGPQQSADIQQEENEEVDVDDTPFTPSPNLDLPIDTEVPSTVKLNQIIEKTAKFISSQGPQMEILLKAKQASNPQFNFLNHDGQYNPYYKHILLMMKNNTYPWHATALEEQPTDPVNSSSNGTHSNENREFTSTTSIVIPKIQYKPSADCTYTQLISKITKAPISELEKKQEDEERKKQSITNLENAPKISSGLLGLVENYNSDSETENEEDNNEESYTGLVPPSDIQVVIDKTAVYVAKNGTDFEQKLICKNDTRFQFLNEENEYHQYYKMKVKSFSAQYPQTSKLTDKEQSKIISVVKAKEEKPQIMSKVPPSPVSFTIKSKEEFPPLKKSTTKLINSDDETQDKNKTSSVTVTDAPSPPRITVEVEEELERQVDIVNAEREEKLAKERLSDKLLNAAREKLGMLPKDKMLQIERKKRAMMFLNQIKGKNLLIIFQCIIFLSKFYFPIQRIKWKLLKEWKFE